MADKVAPYGLSGLITGGGGRNAPAPVAEDPWAEFRIKPAPQGGAAPADDPWAEFRSAPQKPGVVEDVVKAIPAGLARGGAGLVGIPGLLHKGVDYIASAPGRAYNYAFGTGKFEDTPSMRRGREMAPKGIGPGDILTTENAIGAIESVTGPLYQPQTTAGEYANTIAEFVPNALGGPAGWGKALARVAVPAVLSETAGQATKGSALEPWARGAAAVAGGVGVAMKQAPGTAPKAIAAHMTNVSDDALLQAGSLMEDAAARGVNLSWPEAIAQTTNNAASLTSLQRFVEGSERGGEVMRGSMSQRPQQVERAGRAAFGQISDPLTAPSALGPAAAREAQGVLEDGAKVINDATRPLYRAAEVKRIDPDTFAQVSADPVFQEGLRRVRADPWIGPSLKDIPDDSVQVIDAVKKWFEQTAGNLRNPGNADRNNFAASIIDGGRNRAVAAADAATGSADGVMGTYEAARVAQQQARERFLQPLLDGPLGKIAETKETKAAIDALFPTNPLPGSADEIRTTVSALAKRNPIVAERLVRAHLESRFNEKTQRLATGANEFGGAGFVADIAGNPQQRENLFAAIEALPDGRARRAAAERFFEILEATGQRQRMQSPTNSNAQMQETFKGGSTMGEAASLIGGGLVKLPERIRQAYERYRLGEGTAEVARIFTDPKALPLLRQLAKEPSGTAKAQAIVLRLTYLGRTGANSGQSQQPVP